MIKFLLFHYVKKHKYYFINKPSIKSHYKKVILFK